MSLLQSKCARYMVSSSDLNQVKQYIILMKVDQLRNELSETQNNSVQDYVTSWLNEGGDFSKLRMVGLVYFGQSGRREIT